MLQVEKSLSKKLFWILVLEASIPLLEEKTLISWSTLECNLASIGVFKIQREKTSLNLFLSTCLCKQGAKTINRFLCWTSRELLTRRNSLKTSLLYSLIRALRRILEKKKRCSLPQESDGTLKTTLTLWKIFLTFNHSPSLATLWTKILRLR